MYVCLLIQGNILPDVESTTWVVKPVIITPTGIILKSHYWKKSSLIELSLKQLELEFSIFYATFFHFLRSFGSFRLYFFWIYTFFSIEVQTHTCIHTYTCTYNTLCTILVITFHEFLMDIQCWAFCLQALFFLTHTGTRTRMIYIQLNTCVVPLWLLWNDYVQVMYVCMLCLCEISISLN